MEKRRLGRGLDVLIPGTENYDHGPPSAQETLVPLERIEHNPYQPRKTFDEQELSALSESIKTHGVLQPLVVRPVGDHYQLIAGERRLRAAEAAGFHEVPVRIVDFNDQQVLEAALVENIQRTDLNPIEKAQGFQDYLERFEMTHEQLATRVGLDRSTITNLVRLLDLPPEVQEAVRLGQITAGHAKALLTLSDGDRQVSLCKEIIAQGHSVRATETLVREGSSDASSSPAKPHPHKTAHIRSLEDELRRSLATRVEIRLKGKHRGQIVIDFETNDDFERVIEVLRG
jgi:ParB family chromosome partitioning protein